MRNKVADFNGVNVLDTLDEVTDEKAPCVSVENDNPPDTLVSPPRSK